MPTENFWSSTSSAPIQTTATRSSPNSSRCSTVNSSSSLRVARSAFIVSTTRLVKRDCRSAWALNSLIACTPRSDSRKWLDCFDSCTSASSVASRSGLKKAQRSSA